MTNIIQSPLVSQLLLFAALAAGITSSLIYAAEVYRKRFIPSSAFMFLSMLVSIGNLAGYYNLDKATDSISQPTLYCGVLSIILTITYIEAARSKMFLVTSGLAVFNFVALALGVGFLFIPWFSLGFSVNFVVYPISLNTLALICLIVKQFKIPNKEPITPWIASLVSTCASFMYAVSVASQSADNLQPSALYGPLLQLALISSVIIIAAIQLSLERKSSNGR